MGNLIAESWIYTTMIIKNDWNEIGTGFLVSRALVHDKIKIFLITNKHVLNSEEKLRHEASDISIFFNEKIDSDKICGKSVILPLNDGNNKLWREHPEKDIDVLAFDVTFLFIQYPNVYSKTINYNDFALSEKIKGMNITIGDDIMTIGYPQGLMHGDTYFPIVRSGVIATRIGESFEDEILENGVKRVRKIRGFLIDGAVIPGSSGSPVVLKPVSGRLVKGGIMLPPCSPVLLGILAETKYSLIDDGYHNTISYANIGVAFDAITIKETIEQFFK